MNWASRGKHALFLWRLLRKCIVCNSVFWSSLSAQSDWEKCSPSLTETARLRGAARLRGGVWQLLHGEELPDQLLPVTDQPLIVTWRCRAFGCRSCETSCLPAWRLCQLSSPWQHGEEALRAADVPAGKRRSRKFKGQVSVLIDEDCSHITGDSIWISKEGNADNLTLIPICQCELKVI